MLRGALKLERTIIFVDHANLFHNLLYLGIRIDYEKLKEKLCGGKKILGSILYAGVSAKPYPKKRKFLKYVEKAGFVIQSLPFDPVSNKQKGVDVLIYKDIVELALEDAFDKAILVSGDKDFVEIIRTLKALKKHIEIWSFKKSIAKILIEEAGKENVYYLDDILDDIVINE